MSDVQRPLEGRLVRMRPRELEDEPLLHAWANDPDVTRTLILRYPISHAAERDWIAAASNLHYKNVGFSIVALSDDELIGSTGLLDQSPENRSAKLGLMIGDKSRWNQGFGTDAVRVLARFAFEQMNIHRLGLETMAENKSALHIYEKAGFKLEGVRRQARFKFGHYHDMHAMSLLEGELRWD